MADRVMVIGLDGGTWTVLHPYMEAGLLPNLSALCDRSYRSKLRTTLPQITPVAWTSMATGVNPGKHGIFGFGTFRNSQGEYVGLPVHRRLIGKPSLWRILSDHHRTCRVAHVPMTYPPEEVNGSIVTGMFTPGPKTPYAWPAELKGELNAAGIRPKFVMDIITRRRAGSRESMETTLQGDGSAFLDDLDDMTRCQHQVACHLIAKDWQFYMMVYQATDLIQHMFWDDLLPPPVSSEASARARRIGQSLQLVDACVGELLNLAGPETTVMLVSDHGFGPCHGQYALGQWLADHGYLTPRRTSALGIARKLVWSLRWGRRLRRLLGQERASRISSRTYPLDWARTRAFVDNAASGCGVRINVKGLFEHGMVEPGESYERLRDELIELLEGLRIDGIDGAPISRALKREEAYSGRHVREAPDIILVPSSDALVGFVNGSPGEPRLKTPFARAGEHLMDGILAIAGPGVAASEEMHEANITDVAPTVLALLRLPVPDYMDGRVPIEAFTDPPEVTLSTTHEDAGSADTDEVFSEDEQQEIEERLKNLGYLE